MKDKQKGRTSIILAAERLFAEYGLHGASLRQISESAGQKNTSAIHYHFGSREQLVEAVFAHRMQQINPKRLSMLDTLRQQDKLENIRDIVAVMVWPLAEEIRPRDDGNFYVQFMARASRERLLVIELAPPDLMTGWHESVALLRARLSWLPDPITRARLISASDQCVSGLAGLEANGVGATAEFASRVENLIDMISAGLQAPVSPATLRALPES